MSLGLGPLTPDDLDLDAIRAAVAPPEEAAAAWRRWRARSDLDGARPRHHDLFPPALSNLPAGTMDKADEGIVRGVVRRTWYVQQRLAAAAAGAAGVLSDDGIDCLVVGGVALGWSCYPTPGGCRTDEAELVVRPEHLEQAASLLQDGGWASDPAGAPSPGVGLRSPDGWALHLLPWAFAHRFEGSDDGIWEAAQALTAGGATLTRLSDADQLVLAVLTGMRAGTLRWWVDAALLSRTATWDAVEERARPPAIAVRVAPALRMLRDEVGVDVPAPVLERLGAVPVPVSVQLLWRLDRRFRRGDRLRSYLAHERSQGRRPTARGYLRVRQDGRAEPPPPRPGAGPTPV